jgi:hypothetical protein
MRITSWGSFPATMSRATNVSPRYSSWNDATVTPRVHRRTKSFFRDELARSQAFQDIDIMTAVRLRNHEHWLVTSRDERPPFLLRKRSRIEKDSWLDGVIWWAIRRECLNRVAGPEIAQEALIINVSVLRGMSADTSIDLGDSRVDTGC